MKKFSSVWMFSIFFILVFSMLVSAGDYTIGQDTADVDFYLDYRAVPIDAKTYGTISVAAHDTIEMHCVSMAFFVDNSTGTVKYIHVQSNPEPASTGLINMRLTKTTPEEMGYFTMTDGQGNVYFTNKGIRAYEPYLFVVKCSDSHGDHIKEELVTPGWREFAKNAPSRIVWFNNNSSMIIFFLAVLFLVVLFIYARMSR